MSFALKNIEIIILNKNILYEKISKCKLININKFKYLEIFITYSDKNQN